MFVWGAIGDMGLFIREDQRYGSWYLTAYKYVKWMKYTIMEKLGDKIVCWKALTERTKLYIAANCPPQICHWWAATDTRNYIW